MRMILLFLIFTQIAHAKTYIVETVAGTKIQHFQKYKYLKHIRSFSNYKNEYFDRLFVLETDESNTQKLAKLPFVKLVESDIQAKLMEVRVNPKSEMTVNDILFPQLWGLYNQSPMIEGRTVGGKKFSYQGEKEIDIHWKQNIDDIEKGLRKTPVVAVVDMGIDFEHEDLKGQVYFNAKECDENNSVLLPRIDRDENKLQSDCHGWNFAATTEEEFQYPFDDKGHGTHISGIIAAKRNNLFGMSGVSDKIKILPVRVTGAIDETTDKEHLLIKSTGVRIANGILYAVSRGVDVINLSLGWPKTMDTKYMRYAINEALKNNIAVVAAAGNDNSNADLFPCSYHDVICVGSIQANGKISAFSNTGGTVDILAPGDQIVSTIPKSFIPLKLNIQGYDIMSGTSQAAPFVSAATALLKGTYPDDGLDAIKYRLFRSAQKRLDPTKSLNGLLNLENSFSVNEKSFVLPIFKELTESTVNTKNGIFQFTFFLKNYGMDTKTVNLSVESLDSAISIRNVNSGSSEYIHGKPNAISVTAQVKDLTVDRKFSYRVNVNGKLFYHEIDLGLTPEGLNHFSFGFKFTGNSKPLIYKDEQGEYRDILSTVSEVNASGSLPSYYISQLKGQNLTLSTFTYDGKGFSESSAKFEMDNVVKLLSIEKYDFNYDETPDFLIRTLKCEGESCSSQQYAEEDLYIEYSYRTLELAPLFAEYSDIKLKNDKHIIINHDAIAYRKVVLPNKMIFAAPLFLQTGRDTKSGQRHISPIHKFSDEFIDDTSYGDSLLAGFTGKRNLNKMRIYFTFVNEDKRFHIMTLSNDEFEMTLKRVMQPLLNRRISFDDTVVNINHMLNQSRDDFYADTIEIIASIGLGHYQYNVKVSVNNNKYSLSYLEDIDQPLIAASKHVFFDLTDNKVTKKDSFVEFKTSTILNITGLSHTSINIPYRFDNPDDIILSFLGLFAENDSTSFILEKIDSLSFLKLEDNEMTHFETPTRKFSFLPGVVMTESFYPIALLENETKNLKPAIYIDNTAISGNQVYVKTLKNNKFYSPLINSLFIPSNCKTKNPIMKKSGGYQYTLLCLDKNIFKIKYFPIFY